MNKKGGLFAWILVLIFIFVIFLSYTVTVKPFEKVREKINSSIDSEYQPQIARFQKMHLVWPLVMVLGVILAGVYFSLKYGGSDDMMRYR